MFKDGWLAFLYALLIELFCQTFLKDEKYCNTTALLLSMIR